MSIQAAQFQTNVLADAAAARSDRAASQGLFMGARVTQAENPMSLLANAAEELSFNMAEREEKRLGERKEKTGLKTAHSIEPFMEAARKQATETEKKFGPELELLEKLFRGRNRADVAELLDTAKQALGHKNGGQEPDPADQFNVLIALKERLQDHLGNASPLAGTIDLALDNLAANNRFAVASGLAVNLTAQNFTGLAEHDLRGTYRSVVLDAASPREILSDLRARFGDAKLNTGLDFLMTTLGNELSSAGPSVEKSQLKALTGDLSVVRVLGLAHNFCVTLLERLDTAHGVQSRIGSEQMLDALLAARDNQYVGSRDFQSIVRQAGTPDTEREVLFLQDMLQGLRNLPDLFYEGHDARQRLQSALQNALDDAVSREEEELGF
ncbi:MAG: type III secretion system gatekeeper subunit SctW [Deltaproteobacteria bacterium]|jgi:type III secretion protein W|nr:type III secretion system gatekeeper subunit SctW [Deltaproteobacteria bacterium]